MNFYMMANVVMFTAFLYSTIWFVIFGSAPAAWLESSYFLKKQNGDAVSLQMIDKRCVGPYTDHHWRHRPAVWRHYHGPVDQPPTDEEVVQKDGENQHIHSDLGHVFGSDGGGAHACGLPDDQLY
jgi:hypothetical protein